MKAFLDYTKLYNVILDLYKETIAEDYTKYEDFAEECAHETTIKTIEDMKTYVHEKDTKLYGNFCNIRQDWNDTKDFVKSDVKPFGTFDDMVLGMDNDTLSDQQVKDVQTWCQDWFFTAFGTFNLQNNFAETISEMEYIEECEKQMEEENI